MNEKDRARLWLAFYLGEKECADEVAHTVPMHIVTTRVNGLKIAIYGVLGETELVMPHRDREVEELANHWWGVAQLLAAGRDDYVDEPLNVVYEDELFAEADAFFAQPVAA